MGDLAIGYEVPTGDLWETSIGTFKVSLGRIGTYIGLPEVSHRYLVAYMEVSQRSP